MKVEIEMNLNKMAAFTAITISLLCSSCLRPGNVDAHDGPHGHDHHPAQTRQSRSPASPVAAIVTSTRKADDPAIAGHFKPFAESIKYRWDEDYFYVESNGMPDHQMMIGITAWQRQIPILHNYSGDNAWRIPREPVPAAAVATPGERA